METSSFRIPTLRLAAPGLALIAVCYGLARFAYGLFVPAFRAEFQLSATLLGAIAAGSYAGYCAAITISAAAVPRLGARRLAAVAGIVATVGMSGIALARTPAMLATTVLIAGSSTGLASPPLAQVLARWLPPASHDRAQAAVNAGPGAGIALSGPVALLMTSHWRLAWICFAAIAGAVTVWIFLAVPRDPRRATGRRLGEGFGSVVRDRRSPRLVTAAALFGAASACTWTFGRDHVTHTSGLSEDLSILLWTVLGVAELAGIAGSDLLARYGRRRVWIGGIAVLAAATATLGILPSVTVAAFMSVAAFGASYVVLTIVIFFWAIHLHPLRPAAAVALGFLAITAGQALASPLAGAIADHAGATTAFLAFTGLGALSIFAGPSRTGPAAGTPGTGR